MFVTMPTGTSYYQGICACSSRTMCTVTTAISKMPKGKKKSLLDHGIHEYNEKVGELTAIDCLNYCTRNWRDSSDTAL